MRKEIHYTIAFEVRFQLLILRYYCIVHYRIFCERKNVVLKTLNYDSDNKRCPMYRYKGVGCANLFGYSYGSKVLP